MHNLPNLSLLHCILKYTYKIKNVKNSRNVKKTLKFKLKIHKKKTYTFFTIPLCCLKIDVKQE